MREARSTACAARTGVPGAAFSLERDGRPSSRGGKCRRRDNPAGKRAHGRGQGGRGPALSMLEDSSQRHLIAVGVRRGAECRAERGKAGHTAISLSKGAPAPKATSHPREVRSALWPQERWRRLVACPERAAKTPLGRGSLPAPRQVTTGVCTADVRAPGPQRRSRSLRPWRSEHRLHD